MSSADLTEYEIGLHLLALCYRSVDDRLPATMRKHSVDALRRAFQKLEFMFAIERRSRSDLGLSKFEATKLETVAMDSSEHGVNSRKKKRKRMDNFQKVRNDCDSQGESRAANESPRSNGSEDESNNRMRKGPPEDDSNKRMLKDPPQLINTATMMAQRPGTVFLPPQPHGDSGANKINKSLLSKMCSHDGCTKLVFTNSVCYLHDGTNVEVKPKKKPCIDMSTRTISVSKDGGKLRLYKHCSHDGCENIAKKLGKCYSHGAVRKGCSVDGCTSSSQKNGLCRRHFR